MLSALRYSLNKNRMLHWLEELHRNSIEVASLCLPPGLDNPTIAALLETAEVRNLQEDIVKAVGESATGAMLFWGPHHRYLVLPPFPLAERRYTTTCEIEPLKTQLERDYLVGLVLVRLGAYGIGVFRGERLLGSKVGTGLVHARHRQGGSSSHRFERHRYKQMETFFTRVCQHAREQLEPYSRDLDYLFYGGARETILEFRKQCRFMHTLDRKTLDLLLNVREPKQAGLGEALEVAWSSRIIQWDEN